MDGEGLRLHECEGPFRDAFYNPAIMLVKHPPFLSRDLALLAFFSRLPPVLRFFSSFFVSFLEPVAVMVWRSLARTIRRLPRGVIVRPSLAFFFFSCGFFRCSFLLTDRVWASFEFVLFIFP